MYHSTIIFHVKYIYIYIHLYIYIYIYIYKPSNEYILMKLIILNYINDLFGFVCVFIDSHRFKNQSMVKRKSIWLTRRTERFCKKWSYTLFFGSWILFHSLKEIWNFAKTCSRFVFVNLKGWSVDFLPHITEYKMSWCTNYLFT